MKSMGGGIFTRFNPTAVFTAALGIAIGSVLLIGAGDISPPMFDPVGSAALPRACGVVIIALGLGALAQSWKNLGRPIVSKTDEAVAQIRPATLGLTGLMVLYPLGMELGLGFALSTIAFVALSIPLIAARWRALPVALVVALALGLGSQWLFTNVFYVDLPQFND